MRFWTRGILLGPILQAAFPFCLALLAFSPRGPGGDPKGFLFAAALAAGVLAVASLVYRPDVNPKSSAIAALPLIFLMHGLLVITTLARGTTYPFAGSNFGEAVNLSVMAAFVEWGVTVVIGPWLARKPQAAPLWAVAAATVFVLVASFLPNVTYPAFEVVEGPGPARYWRFAEGRSDRTWTVLLNDVLLQSRVSRDYTSSRLLGWDIENNRRWEVDLAPKGLECDKVCNPSILEAEDGSIKVVQELWRGNSFQSGTGPFLIHWVDPATGRVAKTAVEPIIDLTAVAPIDQWKNPPLEGSHLRVSVSQGAVARALSVEGQGFTWKFDPDYGNRTFIIGDRVVVMRELQRDGYWYHLLLLP